MRGFMVGSITLAKPDGYTYSMTSGERMLALRKVPVSSNDQAQLRPETRVALEALPDDHMGIASSCPVASSAQW